ncbi:hypothetical protein RRG08_051542 [Elysia crispata]|uniref:C-type lectin domain-containing protein n=1 Tax=Elysia crispata TaxID=231223 RepID=A0AAE0Y810_9GAST|nr:hypothetical protein RRG08_051542 [Elysia crispata]
MNQFIWEQVSADNGQAYWIGLNDRNGEGKFEWLNETNGAMYSNWDIGQPNNIHYQMHSNSQDCVEFGNKYVTPKRWNDIDCDIPLKFICEKSTTG